MKVVTNNLPLAAIVCGYERGGTTLLSELLRQHPKLDSGFEGGFLLAEEAVNFLSIEPYYSHLKAGWQVRDKDLQYICAAETWPTVYKRLIQRSPIITNKNSWVFDKTPRYMAMLPYILPKIPGVPCIVLVRDPRAVIWSWAKRSSLCEHEWVNEYLESSCQKYVSYAHGLQEAISLGFSSQILLVQYESLCKNKFLVTKRIFDFLGLDFEPSYLFFKARFNDNVHRGHVSTDYVAEYSRNFTKETCQKILELTQECKAWFWEEDVDAIDLPPKLQQIQINLERSRCWAQQVQVDLERSQARLDSWSNYSLSSL